MPNVEISVDGKALCHFEAENLHINILRHAFTLSASLEDSYKNKVVFNADANPRITDIQTGNLMDIDKLERVNY